MSAMASQINSVMIVFSTVYSGAAQRKHQSSALLPLWGEITVTGEFPAQRASNAENGSIWWRHQDTTLVFARNFIRNITVTSHEHHDVQNHWQLDSMFNALFTLVIKDIEASHQWYFRREIHWWHSRSWQIASLPASLPLCPCLSLSNMGKRKVATTTMATPNKKALHFVSSDYDWWPVNFPHREQVMRKTE